MSVSISFGLPFGRPLVGLKRREGSLNSLSDLLSRAFCEITFFSLPEGVVNLNLVNHVFYP